LELLADQRDLTPAERQEAIDLLTAIDDTNDTQGTDPAQIQTAAVETPAPAGSDGAAAAGVPAAAPAAPAVETPRVEPASEEVLAGRRAVYDAIARTGAPENIVARIADRQQARFAIEMFLQIVEFERAVFHIEIHPVDLDPAKMEFIIDEVIKVEQALTVEISNMETRKA
jgi:hypothetical protein